MNNTDATGSGSHVHRAERLNADHSELGKFETLARRFWDPHGDFRPLHLLNPLRTRFVAERVALQGAHVLDVGCGGGLLCESLTREGARVSGIDLAAGMVEVAQLHAAEQQLAIHYEVSAAEQLVGRSERYDVITCMEMLEHVPDPAAMLRTLAHLLRPGGHLFISTLNRNLQSFLLAIVGAEYLLGLLPRGTHEYDRLIRPSELHRWARAAGLSLRELAGIDFNPLTATCRLRGRPRVNYLAHLSSPDLVS
ncbi:MAG: bifunctional 2-polyprenyl-6-hydroxyphenol methylase/3-demethylubiquinol 3-O-methyltransferase UbiG [Sinobacteraceae bacterium]|nr:bifunctional 2-polyprenyl-6-hydroxyphenol methylase/3-demethylubiquinol 3-O-methyltransferase UbiG [Nevskiaceae bacterium]